MKSALKSCASSTRILFGVAMAALLLSGCGQSHTEEPQLVQAESLHPVDLALDPFQQLAHNAPCSDIRNRLFLIDDALVLWDVRGSCADASYSVNLYDGYNSQNILCTSHDSIAGPRQSCGDARFADMFNVITRHLDKADLGLGSSHTVHRINF